MEEVYLFLDIDGVLNRRSDWDKKFYMNPECLQAFDELINKLHKKYDLRIILSSTWRFAMSNDESDSVLLPLNTVLHKYHLGIYGSTVKSNKTRQEEIEYYIRRNGVNKYVILDDDASLFPDRSRINIYLTDYKTGLSSREVRAVIKSIGT